MILGKSVTPILCSVTAFIAAAACGNDLGTTPTPTPTARPSPTPTLALNPECFSTEAYALEHIVAVVGRDAVPTAYDAINRGGCRFQAPITQITVELTGEEGTQFVVIPLPTPTNDIEFPLPSAIDVPLIDPTLPPGPYERTVTVATAVRSGPGAVIPGFEPVLLIKNPGSITALLLRAESRWERSGTTSYTYRVAWQCFCVPEYIAQVDVQVVDDRVTDVAFVEPGFEGDFPDPERFGTVANLFAFIEVAIAQGAARVIAQFHPELGYPTETFVDYDVRIADEEQGFTVLTLDSN